MEVVHPKHPEEVQICVIKKRNTLKHQILSTLSPEAEALRRNLLIKELGYCSDVL